MASEHEHVFDDRWRCAICGEQARRILYKQEQQLAQARHENEKLIQRLAEMSQIPQSQRHALQQENAAMRALLEPLAYIKGERCPFCLTDDGFSHAEDCLTTKARAFLGAAEGQG